MEELLRSGQDQAGDDELLAFEKARSRGRWLAPALILVALAGIGLAVWRVFFVASVRPHRVLVLVTTESSAGVRGAWWGSNGRASARFADAMARLLRDKGLDVLSAGDPSTLEALEALREPADLRAAARSLGAAYTIEGTIRAEAPVAWTASPNTRCVVSVTLSLVSTEAGATPIPIVADPRRYFGSCRDEERHLLRTAAEVPGWELTAVAAAFAAQPAIAALRDDPNPLGPGGAAFSEKSPRLFRLAKLREEQLDERAALAETEAAADLLDETGSSIHPIGRFLDEEYLIGMGPGDRIVLMTEPRHVDVLGDKDRYTIRRGDERLVLAGPDGDEREVVREVYNFFSDPSVTPDGRLVAAVLDNGGWSKSLVVIRTQDGELTELLSDRHAYFSAPVISPDGAWIAFQHRSCRRCVGSIEVVRVDGGARRVLVPADTPDYSLPAWSPDSATLYLTAALDGPLQSVWAFSPSDDDRAEILAAFHELREEDPDTIAHSHDDEEVPDGEAREEAADGDVGGSDDGEAEVHDGADAAADAGAEGTPADDTGVDLAEDDRDEADPAAEEPPAWREYTAVQVSPDGRFLVVEESGHEGPAIGRFELADRSYGRIGQGEVGRLRISPDGARIAIQARVAHEGPQSSGRDPEIGVMPAKGGDVRWLTRNDREDRLIDWSRDGKRIYFHRGSRDPGDSRSWTNRVYWVSP